MKRILATWMTLTFKLKTAICASILMTLMLSFSQTVNAATPYYALRDVYARSHSGGYTIGRLYTNQRMDIQYIDSAGYAYGQIYGYVNKCGWAQFRDSNGNTFRTNGTTVPDKCRTTNKYLEISEFSNGEIWTDSIGNNDGIVVTLPRGTYMWDNWSWNMRWGNYNYVGYAPAGSRFKVRYTTNDGGGIMARYCNPGGGCDTGWVFIQRSALDTIHCAYLAPGEGLGSGQTLNSCDGRFSLAMQRDGNLILYQNPVANVTWGGPLWSSGTARSNARNTSAFLQPDGNFVVYDDPWRSWVSLWSSGTAGYSNSWLFVQNDGNLVLYCPGGYWIWASHTCCH